MPADDAIERSLRAENAELRARLEEAEDVLRAIRSGGVDALVVDGDAGPQLFTLQGLDAEQNRLRGVMLAQVSDAVIAEDTEGRITFFNAAAERLLGMPAGDVMGRLSSEVFDGSRTASDVEAIWSALRAHGEWRGELSHRTRDGRDLYIEPSVAVLRGPDGAAVGHITAIRDISDRKRAEAALRLTTERLDLAVKCSQVVLFQQDLELRYTWLRNPSSGFGGDVVGQRDAALMERAEDAAAIEGLKREVLRSGVGQREEVVVRIDGADRQYDLLVEPLRDAAGLVSGVTCAAIDITERKRAEDALRDHAVALADLDRRKDAFLGTLSHELRNPLGVIRTAVHLMRLTSPESGAVEMGCGRIERQVVLLARLIDDLMDISRINEDKLTLRAEPLDLAALAQSAIENCRPVLDLRGHTLTVVLPLRPIELDGDATRLAQVLSNLLTNAAKYSGAGSPIALTIEREGDVATVAVRDRGIGLAPADLSRVFEMFAQVGDAAHLAQGGLGIGLYLVKRVVELHGGSVEARSEGPGHGCEFLVRLPAASPRARSESPPDRGAPPPAPFRRLRILVADDNADAVAALALLLTHLGHDVRTAENGAVAVAVASTFLPEVALLDIGMPELDGHEACRRIRAQPGGDTILLVALSGWGQEEDKQRSRNAGFDHHLVKPLDSLPLNALLQSVAPP